MFVRLLKWIVLNCRQYLNVCTLHTFVAFILCNGSTAMESSRVEISIQTQNWIEYNIEFYRKKKLLNVFLNVANKNFGLLVSNLKRTITASMAQL